MTPGKWYRTIGIEWFYNTPIPEMASKEKPLCLNKETFLFLKIEDSNCRYSSNSFYLVLKVLLHGQIKYIFRNSADVLEHHYTSVKQD